MSVKEHLNARNDVLKVRCDAVYTGHRFSLTITCYPQPDGVLPSQCDDYKKYMSSCVSFVGLYQTTTLTSNVTITYVVHNGPVDISTWSTYAHVVHDNDPRKQRSTCMTIFNNG